MAPSTAPPRQQVELYVRGWLPEQIAGSLLVAMSRRDKTRGTFSRWQDSQADLLKLDIRPGRPGRVTAHVIASDPCAEGLRDWRPTKFDRSARGRPDYGYVTQPNHGLNVAGGKVWTTNLLFGAPLQVDITRWRAERVLRYVEPREDAPRVSTTSHFAWSKDHRYAYFHQSLLAPESDEQPVTAAELKLVRLDTQTGSERVWNLLPPEADPRSEAWNFHSAFYWEERGRGYVGLLRTGAVVEHLAPHREAHDHSVVQMPVSAIWMIELDEKRQTLQASLLPGIAELGGVAISHLDVDVSRKDGFILYANYKQADVGEETHGCNVYGEEPEEVAEHYSGMIVEAFNVGKVIRYERRRGKHEIKVFEQPYHYGRSSIGHTWLPINVELDDSRRSLYCTFAGFRPRLLPQHVVAAYGRSAVRPDDIRMVPSLMMRLDAETLRPEYDRKRTYLSYGEPIAMAVVGDRDDGYVCTFSPEEGLKVYRAGDFNELICHAVSHELLHWQDTHFRPDPAHAVFAPR